ncbi:twin-arginine translocation pathway signal protein [Actibacterium sp. 188UL27-1]|uniref:Acg family FMN-binding oxidoreductase n=1 Tax=Actibacterium sp. 188UL27-1 TaxID=2786961 RepID=UPI00195B4184|nr:twin-arginine translocation pathway signal protein [Actibacterium sp. 188UL27-1]MBM7066436.1 twin-arginine translocation pathway signal protein [Actibacterium sp. 188UL27-1]
MPLSRRKTLALIGGGTLFAAAAGAGTFIGTRTPLKALAPWDMAGSYGDARLGALSYALLAPNPHNRQPWLAELQGEDTVILHRDPDRDLPVTDPFARQLTIGMGCFLGLMDMAAGQQGLAVETQLFPEGEDGPVAICRFGAGGQPDPLFAHVMERRSHKEAFEARPVSKDATAALALHARIVTERAEVETLRRIGVAAWQTEAATKQAWQESIDLLRIGKAEINAQPDGIDAGGAMLESLAAVGLFTREAAADLNNPGTKGVIEETTDAITGAPAFAVQVSDSNTRIDQIGVGREWLRLNLAATGAGLALRPISQALQEYPEMAEIYAEIHQVCAPDGGTVQMLGLLGYGTRTPRTPRWPLETRLLNGRNLT